MESKEKEYTCSCGRGDKVDGEYYCIECLKENPFLIA